MEEADTRLAEKTKYRHDLQQNLEKYKSPILYFQQILLANKWMEFVTLILTTHLLLWYVVWAFSVVTLVGLLGTMLMMCNWIFTLAQFDPLSLIAAKIDNSSNQAGYTYEELVAIWTNFYFQMTSFWESCASARKNNIAIFSIQACAFFGVLSYIGTMFSGFSILYILVMSLLLIPAMFAYKLPQIVFTIIEPHYNMIKTNVTKTLFNEPHYKAPDNSEGTKKNQ